MSPVEGDHPLSFNRRACYLLSECTTSNPIVSGYLFNMNTVSESRYDIKNNTLTTCNPLSHSNLSIYYGLMLSKKNMALQLFFRISCIKNEYYCFWILFMDSVGNRCNQSVWKMTWLIDMRVMPNLFQKLARPSPGFSGGRYCPPFP